MPCAPALRGRGRREESRGGPQWLKIPPPPACPLVNPKSPSPPWTGPPCATRGGGVEFRSPPGGFILSRRDQSTGTHGTSGSPHLAWGSHVGESVTAPPEGPWATGHRRPGPRSARLAWRPALPVPQFAIFIFRWVL